MLGFWLLRFCPQEVCKNVRAGKQGSEGQVHSLQRQQQGIPHDEYSPQKVIKARSVTFDENNIPQLGGGTPKEESEVFISLSFPPRANEDTVGDNTVGDKGSSSCRGH